MAETFTLELTRVEIAALAVGLAVTKAEENVGVINRYGANVFLASCPKTEVLTDEQKTWTLNALGDKDTQDKAIELEASARAAGGEVKAPWSD